MTEPTEEQRQRFKITTGREWDDERYAEKPPVERKPLNMRERWLMLAVDAVTNATAFGKGARNPPLDFLCGLPEYVHTAMVRIGQSLAEHIQQEFAARDERMDEHEGRLDKIEAYLRKRHATEADRIDARIEAQRLVQPTADKEPAERNVH